MSKNHFVGLTSQPTTAHANTRRAQRNRGNQQEHGTGAEVNGSTVPGHDSDEQMTTVPSGSSLPRGHKPVVFGSTSHESGTSHQVEGRHSASPTINRGSYVTPAAQTRTTDRDDTNREDTDIVETQLAGGGPNGRDSTYIPTVSLASAGSPLGFESGSPNLRSELLETVNLSTSVRHRTADAAPWESIRDRQLEWIREDPNFIRDVRDSVCTAIRDKVH